jgi:hypothetical protein
VLRVSSKEGQAGLMLAIITVLQLPPRLSFSNLVSLLSLYGTCCCGFRVFYWSQSELMQLPSDSKDLFMLAPSTSRIPRLFVLDARSDPAKSIRLSFAIFISADVPCALSLCSTVIYRTAWDLELASLASVRSLVLALLPCRM